MKITVIKINCDFLLKIYKTYKWGEIFSENC